MTPSTRWPAILALLGCIIGLYFSWTSTSDYASHLDRALHDVHCSFIPGAAPSDDAEACRAAMYSPYSALFKDMYWGGIPISLFGLGSFAFFLGFSGYLLLAPRAAPRVAVVFFGAASTTPLLVSLAMLAISMLKLGTLCKTCAGIYVGSFLLAAGGIASLFALRAGTHHAVPGAGGYAGGVVQRGAGSAAWPILWLAILGAVSLTPAVVYAARMPDHTQYLDDCGQLKKTPDERTGLVEMRSSRATNHKALMFVDPLCPTCKALHERLVYEDIFDRLSNTVALFPLDDACNWMLDRPLHPGACTVSKAVLCGGPEARQLLEWAYHEQAYLTRAGRAGEPTLREVIRLQWGDNILRCIDSNDTTARLNEHLHFAVANAIPVSTPQLYLGARRVCDEDTDIGLRFTFKKLAPEVLQ